MNIDESCEYHPVWDVYDEFRTARLNVRYYELELKKLSKWTVFTEYILAISVSSSVTGLWLWENVIGGYVWKALGAIAIFLAISKPILNFTEKIKMKSELLGAYKELDHDFNKLKIRINQNKKYDEPMKGEFNTLLEKKGHIISKYTDVSPNYKLINKCTEQVDKELPDASFYIPKGE